MVEMMAPTPLDILCDPACGTAGFLVASAEYLYKHSYTDIFTNEPIRKHFEEDMFHGFDFDSTMLRVASMNMMLHGIANPDIRNKDSLSEDHGSDTELYTLILANPPFKGSLDYESVAKDLLKLVKTKKTELLFMALFLRLLKIGGRAAVIVPDGVLFGSSNAHKDLRQMLVEKQKLDAIISMPSGVFKPYAGVSTAIVLFTKTNSGGTDHVWFYDMRADGLSLDDKRQPISENDIPDILKRWQNLEAEKDRQRTEQSFFVPKAEIAAQGYDLICSLASAPLSQQETKLAGQREMSEDLSKNQTVNLAPLNLAPRIAPFMPLAPSTFLPERSRRERQAEIEMAKALLDFQSTADLTV